MNNTATLNTIAASAKAAKLAMMDSLIAMSETAEEIATMTTAKAKIAAMDTATFLKYHGVA